MTSVNVTCISEWKTRIGFSRLRKKNPTIDMTPMVDLGFLLISFFVITTQLSQPKAMNLFMPADGISTELGKSYALTIIPTNNNEVYYYHGDWETAVASGEIYHSGYAGENSIRNVIEAKQKWLDLSPDIKEGRAGLMMLIKPGADCTYKNIVDLFDEASISMVEKYALLALTGEEMLWLLKKNKTDNAE